MSASISLLSPRDVLFADGSVWVADGPANDVVRIDPATNAILADIDVPDPASVLASGDGAIWLTSYPGKSLTRIDPLTNRVTRTISLASSGSGVVGVVVADGYVWVANHDGVPVTSIAKVDPRTLATVDVIRAGITSDSGPEWLAASAGSIWADVPNIDAVVRIDPASDRIVAKIPVKGSCAGLVATDAAVWVGGDGNGCAPVVSRIDPATNTVTAAVTIDDETGALALGADGLLVGEASGVARIDPVAARVVARVAIPGSPFGMDLGAGSIWITDRDLAMLYRVARF